MDIREKVISILEELKIDAVLVSDGFNMRYISGFTGATGYLYISRSKSVILTDFRYTIQANNESKGFEVIEISKSGYTEAINDLLASDQVKRLGFEDGNVLYNSYQSFTEKLNMQEMVPVKDSLTRLRIVKTADELENIRMAEHIGDIAFTKILDVIKPGITELEIAAHLEFFMKTNGAQGLSFETIVASGVNSSMPHATPSSKKIELGDFVTMDFGCLYNGYCSDMTRTIVVGKASEEQKVIYNTVLQAQLAALEAIHAGVQGKEIDKIARDLIDSTKYKGCFGHGLGHSVGLFIHEEPRFSPSESGIILANVTETVEPGIYIKDFGGVRIEDLVVVTEDGYTNFTHSEKHLIEL